ncbi:MAG TPA: SAM-dependent methyltransferase [Sphingomicrobium sp.]|nr:SAM-dependent methyltransferase [Sphingomicrobium sp.]
MRAEGPISVEAYMEACNNYYYSTRDPLGRDGDFTTAPEISQMFGELVGAALADCWTRAERPADAIYVELGPGRGSLAADALRVLRSAGFAGDVHLVETSPVLRALQAERVQGAHWHDAVEELPAAPLLLVANEFFDALPIRQFVNGIERRVEVIGDGLAFDRDGAIVEQSPAREQAVSAIATCLVQCGGVALVIDYGHERSAPGDTLQAVRGHRYVPTLIDAGEQDLTSHVDFEALGRAASEAGAKVTTVVTQGDWLNRLGIGARAASLATANPERISELEKAVDRLCHEEQMGQLFKVMAIHSPDWPAPAGFEA